jgi:hypothetical protein
MSISNQEIQHLSTSKRKMSVSSKSQNTPLDTPSYTPLDTPPVYDDTDDEHLSATDDEHLSASNDDASISTDEDDADEDDSKTILETETAIKEKERLAFLINTPITLENDECFVSAGVDDVCYNTTQNRHLILEGMTIKFRLNQQTYNPNTETGIFTGIVDSHISLAQAAINSKNHRMRGFGLVVKLNIKGSIQIMNIFYNDTLMWGVNSLEPKHSIMNENYMVGASKVIPVKKRVRNKYPQDKYYRWINDYDVIIQEKKKKPSKKDNMKAVGQGMDIIVMAFMNDETLTLAYIENEKVKALVDMMMINKMMTKQAYKKITGITKKTIKKTKQ